MSCCRVPFPSPLPPFWQDSDSSWGVPEKSVGYPLLLSHFSRVQLCVTPEMAAHQAPVPGILQTRTLEWVAISFSSAWKGKVKVKSLSRVRLLATPWTAAHQAPPSMGFSRQEYWSGVPLPSPGVSSLSIYHNGMSFPGYLSAFYTGCNLP